MTGVLGLVGAALAGALILVLAGQRRVARRLGIVGHRLTHGVVDPSTDLAEVTSVLERIVDRALAREGDLTLAQARLAGALAVIPQRVAVFDGDGAIVFRNEVAAAFLEARHGEALVDEAIGQLASEVVASGGMDAPVRTVDLFGPPRRTLVLTAVGFAEGAREVGALVVIDDVTARRRLEAVRRDFVSNISHELKTPVGALGLLAETLLSEDEPAVARRLAERILAEAFRVGRTIDDLLELSRIEAAEAVTVEEVPVLVLLTEAVDRVRGAAEQHGIAIQLEEPSAPLRVAGDRRQLVSATYNLLENAVKYSDPGSTVQVRARTDGRWIDIVVEDRGVGIPWRDLERVFERFYRVDRARSRETGGTGLGLAIVRHVANNHAGDVQVESREGEGSTFTLRLPAGAGPIAMPAGTG
ncbi:MAG: sensor histidine kinase [Microthrixaceae bacterium]